MKRTFGSQVLNFQELTTLLCQVEAVLNSRPLCKLNDVPSDMCYLTPGHFLIGRSLTSIPQLPELSFPYSYRARWRNVQGLYQKFWSEWSSAYLLALQGRQKWCKAGPWSPSINEVVILKEDNLPPLVWRLGKIVKLHPGADNIVRSVTLQTSNGLVKRGIVKLCPLPTDFS